MHSVAIDYRNARLEASEGDDVWTVRLANLEARASYLDFALAQLLSDPREAHRAAARLVGESADLLEKQGITPPRVAPVRRERRRGAGHSRTRAMPLPVGLRAFAFALLVITTFMLTTWLSTLK